MNSFLSFKALAAGLAISASALAQAPPPLPPQAAPAMAGLTMPAPGQPVTQSSRLRAFNPGPDGQVQSLYLSNGSVVNLSPDLGREVGAAITKGERVRVSGLRSRVNGQTLVAANSVTLHGQTFVAQPGRPAVAGLINTPPPPPLLDGPGPRPARGPASRPGRAPGQEMARLGPQGPAANGLSADAPAPPPPGPRPPRPGENAPPLPPSDRPQPPAQLSPTGPNPPAPPGAPIAAPPMQPGAPEAQPTPNGPAS